MRSAEDRVGRGVVTVWMGRLVRLLILIIRSVCRCGGKEKEGYCKYLNRGLYIAISRNPKRRVFQAAILTVAFAALTFQCFLE